MAKSGWSAGQPDSTPGELSLSSGLPSSPDDKRPRLGDVPAFATIRDNTLPVAPSRQGANSVASSSASQRAAAEARLVLAEAEHNLALAEARESALNAAVMRTGVEVRKQQYEVELARSSGSRSVSKAGSVVSVASAAKPSDPPATFAQRLAALSASPPSGRMKPAGNDLSGDETPAQVPSSFSS